MPEDQEQKDMENTEATGMNKSKRWDYIRLVKIYSMCPASNWTDTVFWRWPI